MTKGGLDKVEPNVTQFQNMLNFTVDPIIKFTLSMLL